MLSGIKSPLPPFFSTFLWALAYYLTGIISTHFDDDVLGISIVWFPAGVATAAFLVSKWKHWPFLLVIFVILNLLIDIPTPGAILRGITYAIVAMPASMVIAWAVRRFSRPGDDLNIIVTWFFSTLIVSLIDTALFTLGFYLSGHSNVSQIFWPGFVSDVSGIFFATTIAMGMVNTRLHSRLPSKKQMLLGGAVWIINIIVTTGIFTGFIGHILASITAGHQDLFIFAFTGLPIIMSAMMALILGNWGGSLALLTLGAIVITCFNNGNGPLFLKGINYRESILLVQIYLTTSALLLVFLRVVTREVSTLDSNRGFRVREHAMYQVSLTTGNIIWGKIPTDFPLINDDIATVDQVIERTHPDDRQKLLQHWSTEIDDEINEEIEFRFSVDNTQWRKIKDHRSVIHHFQGDDVILGNWKFIG